jgi:hypothetical protein
VRYFHSGRQTHEYFLHDLFSYRVIDLLLIGFFRLLFVLLFCVTKYINLLFFKMMHIIGQKYVQQNTTLQELFPMDPAH